MQATWEAEELRKSNLALQAQLRKAEGTAEDLQETIAQLKHQLQTGNQQIKKLEGFAKQCEAIPGLKKSLSTAEDRSTRLQAERDKLQVDTPQKCKQAYGVRRGNHHNHRHSQQLQPS